MCCRIKYHPFYNNFSSQDSQDSDSSDRESSRPSIVTRLCKQFREVGKKKLLKAVIRNNVKILKELTISPKCYRTVNRKGLNLFQIAIQNNSKEAFDYLLSLPGFPLETMNDETETALTFSLMVRCRRRPKEADDDYFAWKLIEAGADILHCSNNGRTTLSWVAFDHDVKMAEYFIQNGVDVNQQDDKGNTPLHHAVVSAGPDCIEFVTLLLESGADLTIKNNADYSPFEHAVFTCRDTLLHEILFYYTYDEYTKMSTFYKVLYELAVNRSPILIYFEEADIDEGEMCFINFSSIDEDFLKILFEKFPNLVVGGLSFFEMQSCSRFDMTFEQLDFLFEKDYYNGGGLNDSLMGYSLETFANIYYYVLSYGLDLFEYAVQMIYNKFGYCEFFKILLHMDIRPNLVRPCYYQEKILPALLYDVTVDIEKYLKRINDYSRGNVDHLLHHFANGRLKEICLDLYGEEVLAKIENLPQVPLLLELARNSFRKYFVKRFEIKTSRQFYTLINDMNISSVYKKIIILEKMLY